MVGIAAHRMPSKPRLFASPIRPACACIVFTKSMRTDGPTCGSNPWVTAVDGRALNSTGSQAKDRGITGTSSATTDMFRKPFVGISGLSKRSAWRSQASAAPHDSAAAIPRHARSALPFLAIPSRFSQRCPLPAARALCRVVNPLGAGQFRSTSLRLRTIGLP